MQLTCFLMCLKAIGHCFFVITSRLILLINFTSRNLRTEGVDKLQNATDAYVPIVWFEDGVEELNDEAMVQVNTVL